MKYLKYIFLLPILIAWGCEDEKIFDEPQTPEGIVNYRFIASISDTSIESRVALEPDSHGHGNDHQHNLALHWETGDKVVLTADSDPYTHYTFTAVEYNYDPSTSAFVDIATESTQKIYIFESTCTPIPSPFTGTAVYTPNASMSSETEELKIMDEHGAIIKETRPIFRQLEDGDTQHLKCCQAMSARLDNVVLTKSTNELAAIDIVEQPILFTANGEYAYLKIEVNRFNYPIFSNGTIWLYDMDETSDIPDEGIEEYETPLMKMRFGQAGNSENEYFEVPEYNDVDADATKFEVNTNYYLGDEIVGTFYLPVKKYSIKGGHYLAAVLQCGKHGDLYVWEKRVEQDMTFEVGKLYTLDYTDRAPEFAVKFANNTYIRSKYLGQSEDGTSAPYYTLLGEKITPNGNAQYSNRIAYPGGGSNNMLTAADVSNMRNNNGAFIFQTTQMCAIYPKKKYVKWKQKSTGEFDTDASSYLIMRIYKTGNTYIDVYRSEYIINNVDKYKDYVEDGVTKGYYREHINIDEVMDMDSIDYLNTQTYMSKITKGIIDPASTNSLGDNYYNCIEYVLQDRFDPVLHDSKTSKLWRAPYGMNIQGAAKNGMEIKFIDDRKKFTLKASSGHIICLPYLSEYNNCNQNGKATGNRSKALDGEPTSSSSGTNLGTWMKNSSAYRITSSKSVRSFGSTNPAYMQMCALTTSITSGDPSLNIKYSLGIENKFDIALPVLPVFRWKPSVSSKDKFILW